MAELIDIRTCDDPQDVIHRLVECLAAGELVGLPTESSYVLASLSLGAAVGTLMTAATGRIVVAVRSIEEALDFAPAADGLGERLMRRLWPGPVVVEAAVDAESGMAAGFPPSVREAVIRAGHLALAMPDHDVAAAIQRLIPVPLAMLEPSGPGIVSSPQALAAEYGGRLAMVIDDGPPLQPGRRTSVRIVADGWQISEPGLIDERTIRDRMSFGIVFVCTGNTCRSPLAEAIFRKLAAERLNCAQNELSSQGLFVASAGLAAGYGMPAAAESLALAEEFGLDLAMHSSRPLTDDLLDRADYVVTMTAAHRESILAVRSDLADRVHLLSREGLDIVDPIGGGPADYEHCRAEIERELLVLLEHLPIDPSKRG